MDRQYLVDLVNQGLSTRQIAEITTKGQSTVRHWLKKYNLKTNNKSFVDGYNNFRKIKPKETQYCNKCKIILNDNTGYARKDKNIYHSLCKCCHAKETFEKRLKFKLKALKYKGNQCQHCGYNENIAAMDFHHVNPNEKEINPAKLYHKPWDYAKAELDKCIALCSNCHREEHHRLNQIKQNQKILNLKNLSNFSDTILTGRNTGLPSCRKCNRIFTEENQAAANKKTTCKKCDSQFVINKAITGKQRAIDYMGGCCSICGYDKCYTAFDFHHLDPNKKAKNFKKFATWGFENQKKELEHCILVCANCHREIHSKEEHDISISND